MASPTQGPTVVQAIYSFKGKNNDELCFKKGDTITVTQKEEGGWWEGTLNGTTGWFPSNYVKEHKSQASDGNKTPPAKLPVDITTQQKVYRNLVLKDLIDSERANVAELQTLITNFLHPLEKADILNRDEYRQLVGNIDAVVETHSKLLIALEACNELPPLEQRVGKIFLTSAPQVKQIHLSYCSSHPRAICILNKHKDALNAFMEAQGAASPGLLVLTTGLSKPFRRLEKYSGILQELERHIEENHPDRGDTQRSFSVYKDIWSACSAKRRQKEQELEILTGGVRGWEGEELSSLGEIIYMGSVAVGPYHRDRYFVLFPTTLLILSVSPRMSGFIYEGKLPLTGINVTQLPDSETYKNAFEISGNLIDRITAVCQTKEDQKLWVDTLRQAILLVRKSSVSSSQSNPAPHMLSARNLNKGSIIKSTNRPWSLTSLQPLPPMKPSVTLGKNAKNKQNLSPKKSAENNFEEDIQILRVIEAYCSSPKARSVSSGECMNVKTKEPYERASGGINKDRYVLDSVNLLRTQMTDLNKKLNLLSKKLDEEIEFRTALQNSVKSQLSKIEIEKDGGFSTQLSYYVGDLIDGDPLWSARFLKTNPEAVLQTHLDFLKAGAEVIITNSYQASVPGFMEYLGVDKTTGYNLIKESVKLAVQARDLYMKANPEAKKPLIAGSIGPYGASLHDGSEYTGSYIDHVKKETIIAWHKPRLQALTEEGVDVLAIETIPAVGEAEVLLELLKEYPEQKAWLSFQCKDNEHTAKNEVFSEAIKKCWSLNKHQLLALGCNCVNPIYVSNLMKSVKESTPEKIPLIVYPNSGEEYSPDEGLPEKKRWSGKRRCMNIIDLVNDWLDLGVAYVGGCCRMDATDVLNIRKAVKKWVLEHK